MKPVISLVFIFMLIMMTVHCSPVHLALISKRFYDTFGNSNEGEITKGIHHKEDPCENKPQWFLKSQRRLGKFSPFYNCLNEHILE